MSITLASKVEFEELCCVLEKITLTRGPKKADRLEKFISRCRLAAAEIKAESPDADVSLFEVVRLILPQLDREREPHNLKEKSLANLYVRVFCLGKGSTDANKLIHYKIPAKQRCVRNDFAERAYMVLRNRMPQKSALVSLEQINMFLDDISGRAGGNQQKDEAFKILFGKINALGLKWITRIVLKDVKLGLGTRKTFQVLHSEANGLFEVSSNLRHVCDRLHDSRMSYQRQIQVFLHFKPMLLEVCKIEETEKLFVNKQEYFVQEKYDGERSQMHMKDGKFKYYTRQGFDITKNPSYGNISSAGFLSGVFGRLLNRNCKSVILDGELMSWHKEKKVFGTKGMNVDVKKLLETSNYQPCFVAFDVVMYNDVLLDEQPYEERLKILKDIFTQEEGSLILCKSERVSNSGTLCEIFNESIRKKQEGIVVKRCDAKYKPNVRDGSGCYKIKAEFSDNLVQDVDLIILGAYYGEGKYTGLMKSFMMGVARSPEIEGQNPSRFLSVVSVSNGFTMQTLKDLKSRFDGLWVDRCPENVTPPRTDPPDWWIRPEDSVILTLRATELIQSKDYPLGFSLRFPRVTEVRYDKPWYNVCSVDELKTLIKDNRPIQKLTKREVNYDEIQNVSPTKVRKTPKKSPIKLETKPFKRNLSFKRSPVPLSRLFDKKEFCIINGNDELSKEQIEQILHQHRARVVQNPICEDCCVIIGNATTARASGIIKSGKYDAVTIDWLKRVTKEENWPVLKDFLPWELLCSRETTKNRLDKYYDEYYDSYVEDANEENIRETFDRMEVMVKDPKFHDRLMKGLDKKLFDDQISPYSPFRGIIGYFENESDYAKLEFRFLGGTIQENVEDNITHIFINSNSLNSRFSNLVKRNPENPVKIVNSNWIGECLKSYKVVPISEYLVEMDD